MSGSTGRTRSMYMDGPGSTRTEPEIPGQTRGEEYPDGYSQILMDPTDPTTPIGKNAINLQAQGT